MKNAIAIVALAGLTGFASADTVANWGFNDQGLPAGGFGWETSDLPQAADVGSGSFSVSNFDSASTAGVYDTLASFAGTSTGAIDGVSGGSFSFVGDVNNGAEAVFSFDGSAWTDLEIDFARRGTSTGFNFMSVEIFDGGSSLGVLDTFGAATSTWVASNYDLSALNGVSSASIVFTFDGATSSNGNNRLDNVTISGTAIPAPSAAALLGLGGLVAGRRRRA